MSSNDISLNFHGSISADILKLLSPILISLFFNSIINTLNSNLPAWVSTPINNVLATLPLDQPLWNDIWVTYALTSSALNINDYITAGMGAYLYQKSNKQPPSYEPAPIPQYDSSSPKGVQFFLGDYIIQTGIDVGFREGLYTVSLT